MKILHVLDHSIPLHSGYTFRTRAILREQKNLGWTTAHLTSVKHTRVAQSFVSEEEVDGLRFYRTNEYMGLLKRAPFLNQWTVVKGLERQLDEIIDKERPEILHAHSPALNGLAAVNVGRRRGIPVVYEVRAFWEDAAVDHGTTREGDFRYRLTRAMETRVLRQADAITTICEGLRQDIVARNIPASKVTVIPNAVDIEKFEVIEERDGELVQRYGLAGKFVVGFIGSFYAYEGLGQIIEALALLEPDHPDLCVVLVGGGPEESRLKALVKDRGLSSKVIFTGRVPHSEVNRYYSIIDVLAYPRISMRLTDLVTPLKPLEAMAQKRLFVASDVGGHHELIRDGETGMLFRHGEPVHLAEQIMVLKNDPELCQRLLDQGRQYVETERNWKASVANYQSIYTRLVS